MLWLDEKQYLYLAYLNCLSKLIRFDWITTDRANTYSEGKQATSIHSVCLLVCTTNLEDLRWEILLNSLLNSLNMSERASAVETRHFVELKLGDLSTVPCVIVCNCNIRICSTFQRSTAKSSISKAFSFFIILKSISKFWIKMRSCSYPNLICFLFSFYSEHDLSL